jgi:hypothetical protein
VHRHLRLALPRRRTRREVLPLVGAGVLVLVGVLFLAVELLLFGKFEDLAFGLVFRFLDLAVCHVLTPFSPLRLVATDERGYAAGGRSGWIIAAGRNSASADGCRVSEVAPQHVKRDRFAR